jgi:hypothetical protein
MAGGAVNRSSYVLGSVTVNSALTWTSREGLLTQLLAFLDALPPESFEARVRALRLLALVGDVRQLPRVRAFLLDPAEHFSVRAWALHVATELGLDLSSGELAALLRESALSPVSEGSAVRLDMARVLRLVRTEAQLPAVEAVLGDGSPWERTELLLRMRREGAPLPGPVVSWLYARWCQEDHRALAREPGGPERNLQVAAATWTRPESWALIERDAPGLSSGALEPVPEEALHQLLRAHPEALREAAEALRLPWPSLVECLGREGLLRRLEQVLRAQSVSLQVDYGLVPAPEDYPRALMLLGQWPDARPLLLRGVCDFDLALEVRGALLERLLRRERTTALRWALTARDWPANLPLVRAVLRDAAGSAQPGEEALFLAALAGEDAATQCFALEGLLALGALSAREAPRLEALAYAAHPGVRVRAAAGRLRLGRQEGREELVRTACEAPEPWLRAEALRWLGQWEAPAHAALLVDALVDDTWEKRWWPAADEAAWALYRWGSPEALGALLTAHLAGSSADLVDYLGAHLARREGRAAAEPPVPRARALAARFLERPDAGG